LGDFWHKNVIDSFFCFFARLSVWRESYLLLRIFFVEFGDSDPKDPDRIQILFLE
jgi:hypothetical protein